MALKKDNDTKYGCIGFEDVRMVEANELEIFDDIEDCYTIEQQREERKKKEHKTTKRLMKR
jgi:hypothetical protein